MPRHAVRLDAASPSIVVPLLGRDPAELREQAAELREHAAAQGDRAGAPQDRTVPRQPVVDLVEWRVDHLAELGGQDHSPVAGHAVQALRAVREELPELPLLVTLRTAAEGGRAEIDERHYVRVLAALLATGEVDLVDVEFAHPAFGEVLDLARATGVPVVASAHDFTRTPPAESMVELLAAMEHAGAEVCKLAVTPTCPEDVAALLTATATRFRDASSPLITISMGALGAVSRLGGGTFGSAATFAVLGRPSAPGQLPAERVRAALDLLAG